MLNVDGYNEIPKVLKPKAEKVEKIPKMPKVRKPKEEKVEKIPKIPKVCKPKEVKEAKEVPPPYSSFVEPVGVSVESVKPMEDNSRFFLKLRTVRSIAIRILFESLKEILTDVNINFTQETMKISAMDGSKKAMVHLKLETDKFEDYYCENDINLGVNMTSLFKLIKTINNTDTISFYVEKDEPSKLQIRIENQDKLTTYKYRLLQIENTGFTIQPKEFESVMTLPTSDFQKICRDMNNMGAETVEIKSIDDKLVFSCKGDIADQESIIGSGDSGGSALVQGVFSLKFLLLFTKATNLCTTINMFLTNDYPIIIQYSVASLGTVRFLLMPISEVKSEE
jgi:proliferating cell nuclear antigen